MSGTSETVPHTVIADVSTACASAGVALMERRSRALADYWRAVGEVREPTELFALNLGYCSQMMDDYLAAYAEGLKPLSEKPVEAPVADAAQAA
jgi:hypothetical protein